MTEFIKLDNEQLLHEYNNNASIRYLAKKYNTSPITVKKKLLKAGATIRDSTTQIFSNLEEHRKQSAPKSELDEETLTELWGKISINKICQRTGCTAERVKQLADKLDLPEYENIKWEPDILYWQNKDWLYEHYIVRKMSLNSIATKVNSTPETVKKWLNKYNIEIRTSIINKLIKERDIARKALKDCMSYIDCDNLTLQTKYYEWEAALKPYEPTRN